MKKKIIIALSIVSLLLFLGGIYLIRAIDDSAARFDKIIMFHQVEIMRESLLLNIRRVEADVNSQSTRYSESVEAVGGHVVEMMNTISNCFTCHHTEEVTQRLRDLQHQIEDYGEAVNRVLILKDRAGDVKSVQENAHLISDSLISKVNTMIAMTNKKLSDRTDEALDEVHRTRIFLIMLVATGPFLIAALALTVIRGVTGPISILLDATRKLKAGNLEHRIEDLHDEFGELAVGFNAMARSLKEQLKKIEESERRYRLLFESAGDAIFILDAEGEAAGRIVSANAAAVNMHGYSRDEILNMNIGDLDSPGDAEKVAVRMRRINAGEWIKQEVTHTRKDGSTFPVEISAGRFEFGGHQYVLAIDRDITERKQMQQTLQRAEHIKCAGELATGLAHEIKNPLAGIKVSIEVLSRSLDSGLSDEDRDIFRKVIDEIKRIEQLIKGLLNFARPPQPNFAHTNVNAVLEGVADLALRNRPSAGGPARGVIVRKDLDATLPEIAADPMQLRQVFMNLILNAVDAMQGEGSLGIRTRTEAAGGAIVVEISDTGKGIDDDVLNKIFQPFFTTKARGTGLGLAISKRLIEDHGGLINIERNPEGGTIFKIILPVSQSNEVRTA
ncbi:MAG TPA: ATP-binding protein [Nitrospirota bacterium]